MPLMGAAAGIPHAGSPPGSSPEENLNPEQVLSGEALQNWHALANEKQTVFLDEITPTVHKEIKMRYAATMTALSFLIGLTVSTVGMLGCDSTQPTANTAPTPLPGSLQFEGTLEGEDLAKYRSLPAEYREALQQESEETSLATAQRYLRELPQEVLPIAEILPSDALNKYKDLSPRRKRIVLLGYDEAFKERPQQDPTKTPPPSAILAGMVNLAYKMEFGDDAVFLPPMADTLSEAGLARLDSVDTRIKRAFELIWANRKVRPDEIDGLVQTLEEALAEAPDVLPDIMTIGLSEHSMGVMKEVPAAKKFVEEWLAAEIAQATNWRSNAIANIDGLLGQFHTVKDLEALAGLRLPMESGVRPIACEIGPSEGVWPTWALPTPFRNVTPDSFTAAWPAPSDSLSPEALAKLEDLNAELQGMFEREWYGTGPLPMESRLMACIAIRWDARLQNVQFTQLPPLTSFLSATALSEYNNLPEQDREIISSELRRSILKGEVTGSNTFVNLHTLTHEEALAVLGTFAESTIHTLARREADRQQ